MMPVNVWNHLQDCVVFLLFSIMQQTARTHTLRVGSLIFHSLGQLLPHQMQTFHSSTAIFPVSLLFLCRLLSVMSLLVNKSDLEWKHIHGVCTGHSAFIFMASCSDMQSTITASYGSVYVLHTVTRHGIEVAILEDDGMFWNQFQVVYRKWQQNWKIYTDSTASSVYMFDGHFDSQVFIAFELHLVSHFASVPLIYRLCIGRDHLHGSLSNTNSGNLLLLIKSIKMVGTLMFVNFEQWS